MDLAGVQTRPTGFCKLYDLRVETCLLFTDEEILIKTVESKPAIVAIDAPLSLPPGRKSLEERTGNHLRTCDKELLKRHIRFFPITLGPMRKLTTRGIHLKQIFEAKGLATIEVYPGGAQDVLGIPRKQKGLDRLLSGLEKLGIQGLNTKMSDHELDAVTCAHVGKVFLKGQAAVYGNPDSGIVMPQNKEK